MEPQIVLKIDNNHTLKASNFKFQTPLGACDYRTSVLMSTPNNFYPHTPLDLEGRGPWVVVSERSVDTITARGLLNLVVFIGRDRLTILDCS